jgi:hypothetical protein
MPIPTINDVQLVDPVLTNLLIAYQQADTRFVATNVFPTVGVEKDSGQYFIVTKKYWLTDELETRAPGDTFAMGGYGLESASYKTLQYALEYAIPDENRANSQVPMDLEQVGLQWLAQKSNIRKERDFASTVFGASAWDTTATGGTTSTKWSDFAGSDPVKDIRTAKRTISQSTAQNPNVMVCGEIVEDTLLNHPDILDRLKYSEVASEANVRGALAAIFGLERIEVSMAIYNSANTGQDASLSAIIDDDALVVAVNPNAGLMGVTAGKCFIWEPGGGAGTATMRRADDRDSDVLKHKEQWDFKVVASDVGYEFSDYVD